MLVQLLLALPLCTGLPHKHKHRSHQSHEHRVPGAADSDVVEGRHGAAMATGNAHATTLAVDFDVVVYGSTPAGIAADTAAGQLGMHVTLFEPLGMIGGMGAAGALGLHNEGGVHEISGGGGLATVWQMLNGPHGVGWPAFSVAALPRFCSFVGSSSLPGIPPMTKPLQVHSAAQPLQVHF